MPLLFFLPPHHNLTSAGWSRWSARSTNALGSESPPRAPSPPSPTSSPSFSVRFLVACPHFLVYACSTSSCLPADSVCQGQLLARRHGITTKRRPVRRDGVPCRPTLRRWVSVSPGCLYDGIGTLPPPVLCRMTITPSQFACSGKAPVVQAVPLRMRIALEK